MYNLIGKVLLIIVVISFVLSGVGPAGQSKKPYS